MKDVIIIPTYNEKENIGKLIKAIFSLLPSVHILVVDDSSPDGTSQEVENMKKEMPNLELLLRKSKEGLGRAYITAFKKVLTDPDVRCLCTMDADFSHSAEYLPKMLGEIDGHDVVVGSRYVKGGGTKGWPFGRRVLSQMAKIYCQIVLRLPIKDCTSGFLCIKSALLKKIGLEKIGASGFAFLVELKYFMREKGASFKEIPICVENRKEGKSKITTRIIWEGIVISLKLVFRNYSKKMKNLLMVMRDAVKKRGIFFLIYHGPEVFYKTYIRKNKKFFVFQNKCYNYLYHVYNCTCLNERAVEVPIVWEFVERYRDKKILEIGNVLSHYFPVFHDVLDKYEKAEGVINQDVVDFKPSQKYDLIVSISTLEHVGWDEAQKDPEKILFAIDNLKKCLNPGGKIIVTLGLGYNHEIDKMLEEGKIKFDEQYFLKRISNDNEWKEVKKQELKGIGYNYSIFTAQGLIIGAINN